MLARQTMVKKVIIFLLLLLALSCFSGCNEGWSGNAARGKLSSKNNLVTGNDGSSYKGSQAYNASLGVKEEVNAQTGTLGINMPLLTIAGITPDISLQLKLSYSGSGSGVGVFGLPAGWSYGISYVVPDKSVNIDGSNYVLDQEWRDQGGYVSGLKYMNNHGVNFSVSFGNLSCQNGNGDTRGYKYKYSAPDGGHEYFDANGYLLARDNSRGSCISYYYSYEARKLSYIIDSLGQRFDFSYNGSGVTISSGSSIKSSVGYTSDRVYSVTDAAGYSTSFSYDSARNLVNEITYPSGLKAIIRYGEIRYKNCAGGVGTLPAVSQVAHTDNGSLVDKTEYVYGEETSGNNFTGNGIGACLGGNSDALADSNNDKYRYDVTIIKEGSGAVPTQISRVYYNYLHLPMREVSLDSSGKEQMEKIYEYNIDTRPTYRTASFAKPIKVITKSGGEVISEISNSYDDYNQLISSIKKVTVNGELSAYSSKSISYFNDKKNFYIPSQVEERDDIGGNLTVTKNTLSPDGVSIGSSSMIYNGVGWKASSYGYDAAGRMTSKQIAWAGGQHSGVKSSQIKDNYQYANGKLIITETNALGQSSIKILDTLTAGAPLLSETSSGKRTVSHTYDADGRELSVTTPSGATVSMAYSVGSGNNKVVKTSPLGYVQTISYDGAGNPLQVTDNGGAGGNRLIEADSYGANGLLLSKTDMLGRTTSYFYDEYGRVVKSIDPLGNVQEVKYSSNGLETTTTINGKMSHVEKKDGAGNLRDEIVSSQDGETRETTADYDGNGRKISETIKVDGSLYKSISYSYDAEGKLLQSTETITIGSKSKTIITSNSYDLLGKQLTSVRDGINGDQFEYNALGQATKVTNRAGQVKTMSYDSDGNLVGEVDYDGTKISYTYDKDGHQIGMSRGGVAISKSYDVEGKVLSISSSDGLITYSYNKVGKLTGVSYPGGKKVSYTYNDKDQLMSKTNVFGVVTSYGYDSNGRVVSITSNGGGVSYAYGDGTLINGEYGHLIGYTVSSGNGGSVSHSYGYNGWGEMIKDEISENGHTISLDLSKDIYGRLTKQVITSDIKDSSLNKSEDYSYDAENHLLSQLSVYKGESGNSSLSETFSYDNNGNVVDYKKDGTSVHYAYNELDQLTSVDGKNLNYDKAGNLIKDDLGIEYSYDGLNRLTGVKEESTTTRYSYYPDDLLSQKTGTSGVLNFYYDGDHADGIEVTRGGIKRQSSEILGMGGEVLGSIYDNNEGSYYLKVGNSTLGVIDKSGNMKNSYKYSAYGEEKSSGGSSLPEESFLWDGEYTDEDTHLVYLRARFYNPRLKRFQNRDSYDLLNRYNFGNGDPIDNVDPSGHLSKRGWIDVGMGIGLGIAGLVTGGVSAVGGLVSLLTASAAGAIDGALATGTAVTLSTVATAAAAGAGVGAGLGVLAGEFTGFEGARLGLIAATGEKLNSSDYEQIGIDAAISVGSFAGGRIIGSLWFINLKKQLLQYSIAVSGSEEELNRSFGENIRWKVSDRLTRMGPNGVAAIDEKINSVIGYYLISKDVLDVRKVVEINVLIDYGVGTTLEQKFRFALDYALYPTKFSSLGNRAGSYMNDTYHVLASKFCPSLVSSYPRDQFQDLVWIRKAQIATSRPFPQ